MMAKLLRQGIFSVPEAARLIGASPAKVRGWLAGYPNTKSPPLLDNDLGYAGDKLAMSFTNLMEVRFIDRFSRAGVKVLAIRAMLDEAKRILEHPHPFATQAIFKTDGKVIFAAVAEQTEDKALYDLKAKNWAMHDIIAQSFIDGVEFDPNGDAAAWRPKEHDAPNVIIRPHWSFGKPVIEGIRIPTRTIFDAFYAEGETEESVAHWYRIEPSQVKEAVKFETLLRQAA